MGIYDRDYFQPRGSGFARILPDTPIVRWILFLNLGIFLIQLVLGDSFTDLFSLEPDRTFAGLEVYRLVTHAFLHSLNDPLHLLFNMFCLVIFGRELERMYGPREFLTFYLVAAVFSGLVYLLAQGLWIQILEDYVPRGAIGASGACAAVVIVSILYNPTRELRLYGLIAIPAWAILIFAVSLDLFGILSRVQGKTYLVAVEGHLGGYLFGALYKYFDLRILQLFGSVRSTGRPKPRRLLKARLFHPEPEAVASERPDSWIKPASQEIVPKAEPRDDLEVRADAILEKLGKHGRDSLTRQELKILEEASQRARDRRARGQS